MQLLLSKADKLGDFIPIIDGFKSSEIDNHINMMISYFQLNFEDTYFCTRSEVNKKKNQGKMTKL